MKIRASWFGPRTVWSAVALGVVACGGNSSTTVGEDGSGGAPLGGEKGSSGGRSSGDGGRAAGGRDGSGSSASDGGAGVGGAPAGDGGSTAGGSSSGGDSSGGAPGTGGAGGEDDHLYGLGDECETPGEFSCSAANELLALICGGDRKWQVRETCESGEKCDFRGGSGVGLCLAPIEGCETNTSEPICGAEGVETCTRGGFETEVIEECGDGYGCEDAECVMVDDECPEGTIYECEDFATCGGTEQVCGTETCLSWFQWWGKARQRFGFPMPNSVEKTAQKSRTLASRYSSEAFRLHLTSLFGSRSAPAGDCVEPMSWEAARRSPGTASVSRQKDAL